MGGAGRALRIAIEDRDIARHEHIEDLRSALEFLSARPGELETVAEPVEGWCELGARYAPRGGGVPVRPPTRCGPAMLFERVMPADRPVVVGMFGSRQRCASYLGTTHDRLAAKLVEAAAAPLSPTRTERAPVQEVVRGEPVDLAALPIPTMTPDDAGPYLSLGLVMARDPSSGARNISVHRLCVQSPDTLTIWMVPGRHLESFYLAAKAMGKPLPVAIHIGLDPAVYIASCCLAPLTPLGFDELDVVGALRGRAVALAPCVSVEAECIAHAEYVLEGEISHELLPESRSSTHSMPEFLGYDGKVHPGLPVVKVKAVTHRAEPLYQTVIGPGYEQSSLLALGLEAAVLDFIRRNVTPRVLNAYCPSAGGGQLLLFLQFRKDGPGDDAIVRRAALAALGVFRVVKHIFLVDEDVDVFSEEDVWWALSTRFQVDRDLITATNVEGYPLDPTQDPAYSPSVSSRGASAKAVFDCTVPYEMKESFLRTDFSYRRASGGG